MFLYAYVYKLCPHIGIYMLKHILVCDTICFFLYSSAYTFFMRLWTLLICTRFLYIIICVI